MGKHAIRVLDLFAGAGGMTAGFHKASARFRAVGAVEWDRAAAASFEATFGEGIVRNTSIQQWLADGDLPRNVDVIIGGPPCQGFSTLGKQNVEDDRNSLWREYAKTILAVQPKYFVVENVAAFAKSPQFGLFREAIESGELKDYDFQHGILNAADFGAPQARKRAVLIGHHRDLPFPGMPIATHKGSYVSVAEAFASIPKSVQGIELPTRTYEFEGEQLAGWYTRDELHLGRNYSQLSLDRFREIPRGGNRKDLPDNLKARCWIGHNSGSGDVMGRLHLDRPSVTIRTEFFKPEKGRYLHPTENRAITHYEAAVLQGFPATHKFVGSKVAIARQIGNAVPIPLGAAIGRVLAAAL
jgi:DNA (cytosine-5)-methyltransferase 1